MTDKEILYISTIAQCSSITKAAEKLFISQPSLTQALHRIEAEWGAELFLRESWEQTNGLDDAAVKEHNLQALHILGQILVQVRLESSAAWWIDHSCGDGACLLRRVYREQHPKEIQV